MDRYEEAVLEYITAETHRFVNPQFDIPYQNREGGSCPDFVVLEYKEKSVYVIEVSTASDIKPLIHRIEERQSRWIDPVKKYLGGINSEFLEWNFWVTVFVRETNKKAIQSKFIKSSDVAVKSIEEISFPYAWEWNGNKPCNPLR